MLLSRKDWKDVTFNGTKRSKIMTGQVLLWKVKASMSMDRTWAEHSWLCANRIKNESEVAEVLGFQVREWDEEGGTCFSCLFPHPTLPPPNSRCFFLPPHTSPLCWSLHCFWGSHSSSPFMYLRLPLLSGSRWPGHPWRRNCPSEGFGLEPLQGRSSKWRMWQTFFGIFLKLMYSWYTMLC